MMRYRRAGRTGADASVPAAGHGGAGTLRRRHRGTRSQSGGDLCESRTLGPQRIATECHTPIGQVLHRRLPEHAGQPSGAAFSPTGPEAMTVAKAPINVGVRDRQAGSGGDVG